MNDKPKAIQADPPARRQQLRLSDLVAISNNSRLTNMVLSAINEKLDDADIRNFKEWLHKCVNQ